MTYILEQTRVVGPFSLVGLKRSNLSASLNEVQHYSFTDSDLNLRSDQDLRLRTSDGTPVTPVLRRTPINDKPLGGRLTKLKKNS